MSNHYLFLVSNDNWQFNFFTLFKGSSIKDVRTKWGRRVCQMRTLLLIVAYKRAKYTETGGAGGGVKNGKILRTSFMDGP